MESRRKAERILLAGGLLLSASDGTLAPGDLFLEGERIAANTRHDAPLDWPKESFERLDLAGRWIMPGFVQAHLHLCQTLFRGWAEGRPLYRWLSEVIWPGEASLDAETITVAAELAVAELRANGTTAILDMGTTHHSEAIAEVLLRSGLRATLGPALMDQGPDAARPLLTTAADAMKRFEAFAARYDGADHGRLRAALCPRFVPSVSDALWREIAGRPDLARVPIHTHGAETKDEVAEVRARSGHSPIQYLARLEGAAGRVCLAHAVWLDDADRSALAANDLAVCHCPSSNMKLGSGLADTTALRASGVRLGLGADGAACNNRLDPWQEMRLAAHIASTLHGPTAVDPKAILWTATGGGAAAIGRRGEIGTLVAGEEADLLVLDPRRDTIGAAAFAERADSADGGESAAALLVFAGSSTWVRETWVAGRVVYRADEAPDPDLPTRVKRARMALKARMSSRGLAPA